jgi:hypothetical protein
VWENQTTSRYPTVSKPLNFDITRQEAGWQDTGRSIQISLGFTSLALLAMNKDEESQLMEEDLDVLIKEDEDKPENKTSKARASRKRTKTGCLSEFNHDCP